MADYKVQLKDKDGNRQYPVTTTMLVVDSDGKTVEQRLQKLELGGGGSGSGGSGECVTDKFIRTLYGPNEELTDEQRAYNVETFNMYVNPNSELPTVVVGGAILINIDNDSSKITYGLLEECPIEGFVGSVLVRDILYLFSDGSVQVDESSYTQCFSFCLLYLSPQMAEMFFTGYDKFAGVKGVMSKEGRYSFVDTVVDQIKDGSGTSRYVEWNSGDKRYRTHFDASYSISRTEEISIGGSGGGDLNGFEIRELKADEEGNVTTEEQKAYNIETYNKLKAGENIIVIGQGMVFNICYIGAESVGLYFIIPNVFNRGLNSLILRLQSNGTLIKHIIEHTHPYIYRELKVGDGEGNYTEEELAYNQETYALMMDGISRVKFILEPIYPFFFTTQMVEDNAAIVMMSEAIDASEGALLIIVESVGIVACTSVVLGGFVGINGSNGSISNEALFHSMEMGVIPNPAKIHVKDNFNVYIEKKEECIANMKYVKEGMFLYPALIYGFSCGNIDYELIIVPGAETVFVVMVSGWVYLDPLTSDEEDHNAEIIGYSGISNGRFVAYDKGITRPMLMINGRQFVIYHSADEGFKTYEIQDDGKVTLVS